MIEARPFDLLTAPLDGTNLVEASAGTGKTYTITGLFLRLIVERHLPVDQILVVTFTEAATAELNERIRARLRETLQAFSGQKSPDSVLNDLVARQGSKNTAMRQVGEALRAFDQAAILTIHGFCMRVLRQNAFESGAPFDTEMIIEQQRLKEEIVQDFWRQNFYEASRLFIRYAIDRKITPAVLLDLSGQRALSLPFVKIVPGLKAPDTEPLEEAFNTLFEQTFSVWPSYREEILHLLHSHSGLNRNRYRKKSIPKWIAQMDTLAEDEKKASLLFNDFVKFTISELNGAVKTGCEPPKHLFFVLCQRLYDANTLLLKSFDKRLMALKADLFRYLHEEMVRRKTKKNVQFFDDLLLRVHESLQGNSGGVLARALRARYRAVLIDEFQDTDPIQYEIVRRIFDTEGSTLFFIGDPKQAIYRFRGADVFAYIKAAEQVEAKYTLARNWRACPGLVAAVNTVFSNVSKPFVYDEIPFEKTTAARSDTESLKIDGQVQAPFQLWFVDRHKTTGKEDPIPKTTARDVICLAVAGEIIRLVGMGRDQRAFLDCRPLVEGDIAVLVRSNNEAHLMHETLCRCHVPSVVYSAENLFDARDAMELERILAAIAEPNHDGKTKAALATDIMGITGEALDLLANDESAWEQQVVRFNGYHHLWREKGFIRMFRAFLSAESVLPRLMGQDAGERKCTNLLHLSEVLQQASTDKKLGMAGLVKWLSEQRNPETPRLDEYQMRLERDEAAVKIITIHRSKGLEYPVVFCPFAWDGSRIRGSGEPFTFHDKNDGMRLTLDLGSAGRVENRMAAETENLAENLRLVYVAMTRAKHRCYFVWGRINDTETSAPAYLFHGRQRQEPQEDAVSATAGRFEGLTDADILQDLEGLVEKAGGAIELSHMSVGGAQQMAQDTGRREDLVCRRFSETINCSWRIASFSSLVTGGAHREDAVDFDTMSEIESYGESAPSNGSVEPEIKSFFDFPKGTLAGIFVHDVFEHLNFMENNFLNVERLVAEKLKEHGFDEIWKEATCRMIRKVLAVSLETDRPDFTLAGIQNRDRLNELSFYFPLNLLSPQDLYEVLGGHFPQMQPLRFSESLEKLHFSPTRGFIRGFMDMVFQYEGRYYIVDWKSNHLGARIQDYDQKALAGEMVENYYYFQYLLYAVALHQYLRLRVPGYAYEKDFGAIYYLFVRGMDDNAGPEYGVFRDRPSPVLIEKLTQRLIARGNY